MPAYRIGPAKHGRGLFACRAIRKGETILAVGPARKISYRELLRKRCTDNPLQISPRRYLDWSSPGVIANHSCEPNCGLTSYPDIRMIALRDIRKGEELTWDYRTSIDKDTECDFTCACGAKGCTKAIGGFYWLPKRVKTRFLRAGVVQEYLLRER